MKRLLLLLLVVPMAAFAQLSNATRIQGRNIAPTAPTDTQCLAWNAGVSQWQPSSTCGSGGGGSPGGSNTQVQFNDSGSFGGDAGFTYNKTTDTIAVTAVTTGDGTKSGSVVMGGVTSGAAGFAVNDIAGTAIVYLLPATNGTADQILVDSGSATCPTLASGTPATCHQLAWLSKNGTGNYVGTTSPTISSPTITGHATIEGVTSTGATGTGKFVFDTSPTISGPTLTGDFSAGGATRSAPFRIGTIAGLPASCTVGDMYFASNATAGRNLYFCAVTDTWTLQVVGAGGIGCVPGGSAGQFIVDDGAGACTSLTILTRTTNTIAGSAALTFDLSASTAIKVPGALTTGVLHNTTSTGAVVGGLIVNADITNSTIDLTAKVTGALPAANMANAVRDTVIGVIFDGGGSALAAGTTVAKYVTVPFACTIVGYNIAVDAGTATFKTWRKATGTAIPTNSDSISTSGVAISSGTALQSTTTSDWTSTAVSANDILGLNLSAVATATQATFEIVCRK